MEGLNGRIDFRQGGFLLASANLDKGILLELIAAIMDEVLQIAATSVPKKLKIASGFFA
jgi:hypothetical protein